MSTLRAYKHGIGCCLPWRESGRKGEPPADSMGLTERRGRVSYSKTSFKRCKAKKSGDSAERKALFGERPETDNRESDEGAGTAYFHRLRGVEGEGENYREENRNGISRRIDRKESTGQYVSAKGEKVTGFQSAFAHRTAEGERSPAP